MNRRSGSKNNPEATVVRGNHAKMLDVLSRAGDWVTAAELADQVGVTPRSIRSYVGELKDASAPLELIASSPRGYRIHPAAYASFMERERETDAGAMSPAERSSRLLKRLLDDPHALDIYAAADESFVSESTIESDLTRLRARLEGTGLRLVRTGSELSLDGDEIDRRRMLSLLYREDAERGGMVLLARVQSEFGLNGLGEFKSELLAALDARGYFVNEYGINDVLLHVAIALDRVSKGRLIQTDAAPRPAADGGTAAAGKPGAVSIDTSALDGAVVQTVAPLAALIPAHFGVALGTAELQYLAILLATRVIAPGKENGESAVGDYLDQDTLETVRRIVDDASSEYLVDLRDTPFTVRLALHVQNLLARAGENSYSRNPLTRSIKTSYPLIYELAVYIASRLQQAAGITVTDDEIAYIAMHVGAYLEQQSRRADAVTCALVCPGYYDMHRLLRDRIQSVFGQDLEVRIVISDSDTDWSDLDTDLVLTTIPPAAARDNVIMIQQFLTDTDVDRVRAAIARIRRGRRRTQIKRDLLRFFDESQFLRNFYARDEFAMIRALGDRMIGAGLIDGAYVDGALERERMSSTAFTDSLAVPHAMAMTARETAITIVLNEHAMDWGESRVNVIAFVAFNAEERRSFQAVFDQFVEVFSDRDVVQQLIARSADFPSFIDELVHVIDS
jgi:lichenan operon transcriptional antiterminator